MNEKELQSLKDYINDEFLGNKIIKQNNKEYIQGFGKLIELTEERKTTLQKEHDSRLKMKQLNEQKRMNRKNEVIINVEQLKKEKEITHKINFKGFV